MKKPVKVSTVLADLATNPQITQDAREAIQAGLTLSEYRPHPECPCERCHRAFRTIP